MDSREMSSPPPRGAQSPWGPEGAGEPPLSSRPGGYGGPQARPPSRGGTIFMGVLCILFALICGCGNWPWMLMSAGIRASKTRSAAAWTEQIEASRGEHGEKISPEVAGKLGRALASAFHKVGEMPELDTIQSLAVTAMALQLLVLVTGIMLLVGSSMARFLGVVAGIGLVVVYMAGAGPTAAVVNPFLQEMTPVLQDLAQMQGQQIQQQQLLPAIEAIQKGGGGNVAYGVAVLFSIFPLILTLVLLFSGGIKRSLGGGRKADTPHPSF